MNSIELVFVNGIFSQELSDIQLLSGEIEFRHDKGLFLRIPKHYQKHSLIYARYIADGSSSALQNNIILEEGSQLTLVEEYLGSSEKYTTNIATTFHLNPHSSMDYYKLQNEHYTAVHQANILVEQKKASEINLFFADCGSHKSRTDLQMKLLEPHAVCQMRGLYFLNQDEQHIENYVHVEHMAEHGKSTMLYKGVLDKKSRALFNGKVKVYENAQNIDSHQANHNLLLSSNAEVSTRPQLEIYADNVKCAHGATVGQLNHDSLFYLRSRGIDEEAALKLLTLAFVAEVTNTIEDPYIKQFVQARVSLHDEYI